MKLNNNTSTLLQQLLESIRKPLLFFIPSALFENLNGKKNSVIKAIRIVDSIVILNIDGSVKYIESGIHQITILEKETILNNSIFSLLQQQSELNDDAFEYLIDKYTNELLAWVDLTKIMIEYIENEKTVNLLDNYYSELLPFFKLQHDILLKHQNNYFNQFSRVLKVLNLYNRNNSNNPLIVTKSINLENIEQQKSEKLINEDEADNYLLEYIFNIDLEST